MNSSRSEHVRASSIAKESGLLVPPAQVNAALPALTARPWPARHGSSGGGQNT